MIQVGQVLDKYELQERVGQGGMAVVYRASDRSLKRTVAIKILHKHLADYQEARDRFEREAQAVAKLRHENILEIYDYAARPESEAYIVTEFIDGQTLKQFITARPIAFPEVGAMIILQVARALAHAHSAKILHRDVKPENIMIRSDGVVKLMDFGISHMVDLERLTVTGQLLGSPAYMAPEHVEGRPIDFRTDVFAVGIVLYQLSVGRLPFEGKNPHEVLKRIAECKFVDPRQANPRIGNRLGRIILKAMAADPDNRYAGIGEMVIALEGYLEESGIAVDKLASELARYFKSPASYDEAFKQRLVDALTRRGETLLDDDQHSAALDVFDRVLTIDPKNERVVKILDGINRRKKMRTAIMLAVAAGFVAGASILIQRQLEPPESFAFNGETESQGESPDEHDELVARDDQPPPERTDPPDAGPIDATAIDASVAVVIDAGAKPDAAITPPPSFMIGVAVHPWQGSTIIFNNDAPIPATDGPVMHGASGETRIRVHNDLCEDVEKTVPAQAGTVPIDLHFLPARVRPTCDVAGATVQVNGSGGIALGSTRSEPFDANAMESTKSFTVVFFGDGVDSTPRTVTVKAAETLEVKCVKR